jgi:hypothetical protein
VHPEREPKHPPLKGAGCEECAELRRELAARNQIIADKNRQLATLRQRIYKLAGGLRST